MNAVALTDTMNVFGSIELSNLVKDKGVKAIYGAELLVAEDNVSQPYHLVVLCRNKAGFANLRYILSRAAVNSPREDVHCTDKATLRLHSEGLIALSACLGGEIPQAIMRGIPGKAESAVAEYLSIFGAGNFYLELEANELQEQKSINRELAALGNRLGVPCVATNNVHYLNREDAAAHAVLVAIAKRRTLSIESLDNFPLDSFHFASEAEMRQAFAWFPEAVDNAGLIADSIESETITKTKDHHFPTFIPPEDCPNADYLAKLARAGLEKRLNSSRKTGHEKPAQEYHDRLEHELGIITTLHYDAYYLVVEDFIRWSREHNVPVGPGRGSGAGSLVAYAVGITDVDPLSYDLLFERFLNSERISPPDFDIDFCKVKRAETIDYVTNRYGREYVSQIVTFGTLKAKAALKDAARVLGFSFAESDTISKMIPGGDPKMTLKKAWDMEHRIPILCESESRFGRLWDLSLKIEGLARQTGKHAAGVVIADRPVEEYSPLYVNDDGSIVTQYDMAHLDYVGLIKFDFLGLLSLTVIDHALSNIKLRKDKNFDLNLIPLDDKATFDLVCAGKTAGVFQLETRGITELVKRVKPDSVEDIVATIALFRPGPLQNKMDEEFIAVKHNHKKAEYAHELLKPILKDTYGTILYQEQVMLIASELGGFSLGQADILRKGMGKKDADALERQKIPFVEGCSAKGIKESVAVELFDKLAKFGSYGFNKSHSVAYAYLSYQMAYLKAHFPVEFICAVLYAKKDNQEDVMRFLHEARESGIRVLPPDVNRSDADFTVEDVVNEGGTVGAIRFGLTAVKGVGVAAIDLVTDARKDGPFKSVADFLSRIDTRKVNRRVIECLIKAGAFDEFGDTRRALFEGLGVLMDSAASLRDDRESGQFGLFDMGGPSSESVMSGAPHVDEWPLKDKLGFEREALGYYVTGHPLDAYRDNLKKFDVRRLLDISEDMADQDVLVSGMVLAISEKISKRTGDRMAFVTIDDGTGQIECGVFSRMYPKWEQVRDCGEPLMISGKLSVEYPGESDEPRYRISCDAIQRLDEARRKLSRAVVIRIDINKASSDVLQQIKSVTDACQGPTPVELHMTWPGVASMVVRANSRWAVDPDAELVRKLTAVIRKAGCGLGDVPVEIL
jgi:DNA polymerase-3 subunit alpha